MNLIRPILRRTALLAALFAASIPAIAAAQSPTGTISGRIYDQNGGVVGGATVTIESSSLQGRQSVRTSDNGDYIFKFLPPGSYTITFEQQGFATARETVAVAPTESVERNITLKAAGVQETVTVTAALPTFVNTTESAANLRKAEVETLPTTRSLTAYVDLAPAVHLTGPGNNISISGAMSFDNLFLLNGAVIQDNVRAEPLDLYIEDAIQEVTTANSGISAEFGRFQGGVVTAVTRSGGNIFSGSYRASFTNDNWRTKSPFGEPKTNKTVPTHEFTFGGPAVRDRLWFFGAGRVVDQTSARETSKTRIPYEREISQQRFEGKVTARATDRDRLQIGYMQIAQETTNSSGAAIGSGVMDLASLINRTDPQNLLTVNYTRTIGSSFFLEAQVSRRYSAIQGAGGKVKDQVLGTPILDGSTNFSFWQPGFCGICGDEERNNEDVFAKGSYFLSTKGGSHHMTFGYDMFNDRINGDNGQSGSEYWVISTASEIDGTTVYPVIASEGALVIHWPITESSHGTNFRTHSLFYQDSYAVNRHLTLDLGLRYDRNHGVDSAGNVVSRDGLLSPRLGLVWDPNGDGRTTFNASYGRYAAGLTNTIANSASPAGLPSILVYVYEGPDVNVDPSLPLVPTDAALTTVFNWFNANRADLLPIQNTIPGVLTRIGDHLKSPHSDDYAAGVSRQIGTRAALRFDIVRRTFKDFYSQRTDLTTGQVMTDDAFGDIAIIENTNDLERTYTAFNAQGAYRAGAKLDLGASYTLSALKGTVDGEDVFSGPLPADINWYPEYQDPAWSQSKGYLSSDQRHRLRAWANVVLPFGGPSDLVTIGVVQQAESGTPYGAAAKISLTDENGDPYFPNPGYLTPPEEGVYFFGPRDEFRTDWMYRTDLAFNYNRRFSAARRTEAFVQFQILNVFNRFQAFNNAAGEIDTTILTSKNDIDLAPFNPYTQAPVKGVNWDYADTFGKPVTAAAYTAPRTFRMSLGLRF
jgi:outer membrane receptor for ferrienterochelin and colicin